MTKLIPLFAALMIQACDDQTATPKEKQEVNGLETEIAALQESIDALQLELDTVRAAAVRHDVAQLN